MNKADTGKVMDLENITWVTNQRLCDKGLLEQAKIVLKANPRQIILREKYLSEEEYISLAADFKALCEDINGNFNKLTVHFYKEAAFSLGIRKIHLPLYKLREMSDEEKKYFREIGVSVHSLEELKEAMELGATYVAAGHIYATNCKKDVPPRGIEFLKTIVNNSKIPVYAIGGMDLNQDKLNEVTKAGAKGAFVMSALCTYGG